jgi:hypothetical protein
MSLKITTEEEITEYNTVSWGPFSFNTSFKNYMQIACLLVAMWLAFVIGKMTEDFQVGQTAYLFHGIKEVGSLGATVHYCEPVYHNGTLLTMGEPYVAWDCRSEQQKKTDCIFGDLNYSVLQEIKGNAT